MGATIGGDCAGAKEPLPDRGVAVAVRLNVVPCPLAVVDGCGCESGKGVPGVAECAGVEAPVLPPIDRGGVLCPSVGESATGEPECAITGGGGVEVFTMGRAGEACVAPGERLEGLGVIYVAISSASTG